MCSQAWQWRRYFKPAFRISRPCPAGWLLSAPSTGGGGHRRWYDTDQIFFLPRLKFSSQVSDCIVCCRSVIFRAGGLFRFGKVSLRTQLMGFMNVLISVLFLSTSAPVDAKTVFYAGQMVKMSTAAWASSWSRSRLDAKLAW